MRRRILIVDGHNIIHQWPELLALHRRKVALARDSLVKILTAYQDTTGAKVVVVFDGKGEKTAEPEEPAPIQVFYSGGRATADDVVERLAAKYAGDNDLTVATTDFAEQQTVMSFGAHCISAKGLAELIADARSQFDREAARYRRRKDG